MLQTRSKLPHVGATRKEKKKQVLFINPDEVKPGIKNDPSRNG
jgi:hypothetical protein